MFPVQDVSSVETTTFKNAKSWSSSLDDVTSADNVTYLAVVVRH